MSVGMQMQLLFQIEEGMLVHGNPARVVARHLHSSPPCMHGTT